MKKILVVLAVFALAAVPTGAAFAISGRDGSSETKEAESKTTESENEIKNETESRDQELTPAQEVQREVVKKRAEALREAAKKEAEVRSEHAKQAAEERHAIVKKDRCVERKNKLTEALPRLSQGATSVKKTLDDKYQRVQDIHASNKLTAANYDTLKANVDAAKLAAETSIGMVTPSSVTIDCENGSLGTQLDSYRSTVRVARDSLKKYHAALVELIRALTSAEDASSTTEGATDVQ